MQLAGGVLLLAGLVWLWGPWALVLTGTVLLVGPEVPGLARAAAVLWAELVDILHVVREAVNDDAAVQVGDEPVRAA